MFCARCGQEIPDSSELCPQCGQQARLQVAPQPAAIASASPSRLPYAVQPPVFLGANSKLKGVGGWLLFFCISMTILAPLFSLPAIASEAQRPSPRALLDLARLALTVITGIFVWRVDPRALILLRVFFGVTTCIAVLGIVFANTGITHSPDVQLVSLLYGRTLVYVVVWFLYFRSSARVWATFGRNI